MHLLPAKRYDVFPQSLGVYCTLGSERLRLTSSIHGLNEVHEAGIAQSLIELAEEHVHRSGLLAVSRVGVRVGELAGVDPESLRFCFNCLKESGPLAASELVIEWRSRYGCSCVINPPFSNELESFCPVCHAPADPPEGESLRLLYLDWTEDDTQ
jgi:hydrogenase nickel incorporation protein HypA/HybF